MKIAVSLKSDFAYDRLRTTLRLNEQTKHLEVYETNIENVHDLDDAIEFYKADLYILDPQLENFNSIRHMVKTFNCDFIEIENNIKNVFPMINSKFGIEEEVEQQEEYQAEQEKQEIISQSKIIEKIIEKEIIRTKYEAIPSKVVIVGSLFHGAGSTILASNLAKMVGERGIDAAYVEHPLIKPYMYDYLQIHQQDNIYYDISREIELSGVARSKRFSWEQDKVKWHVINAREPSLESFTYEKLLILLNSIQASVIIVDISDRWLEPETRKILYLADSILLCTEPDPIKCDWAFYGNREIETKEKKILDYLNTTVELSHYEIVMMKSVKNINKQILEMFGKKTITQLPNIPYEDIYEAVENKKLLYDYKDYREVFENNLLPVIKNIVPKNFIDIRPKGIGIFKRFLSKEKKE